MSCVGNSGVEEERIESQYVAFQVQAGGGSDSSSASAARGNDMAHALYCGLVRSLVIPIPGIGGRSIFRRRLTVHIVI
jgi:hypothetical protein